MDREPVAGDGERFQRGGSAQYSADRAYDVGYSDLGCDAGEIETPNLDRLAAEGIRFSEFHVNPMCVVTRTSLLTGHEHSQSDKHRRSIPIAQLMRMGG